jgi:hypothetical protein
MFSVDNVDSDIPTRELIRVLRVPQSIELGMPENAQWRAYLELRKRGEEGIAPLFIQGLRSLHRRRTLGAPELSNQDGDPDAYRMAENPYVGELWKSYKRCLVANRTGPAAQILRELESQIC